VVGLGQRVEGWGNRELKKCPQPAMTKLLKKIMKTKKDKGAEIEIIKMKGHSGIEGNKQADKRAKRGAQLETTYFTEKDLEQYQNIIDLQTEDKRIKSNYRKTLKQFHENKITQEAKTDRNEIWRELNKGNWNIKLSHEFIQKKQTRKVVARTIIKARTDTLPNAVNMVQRNCENITSENCPMCEKKENTRHILLECKTYERIRVDIEEQINAMIDR